MEKSPFFVSNPRIRGNKHRNEDGEFLCGRASGAGHTLTEAIYDERKASRTKNGQALRQIVMPGVSPIEKRDRGDISGYEVERGKGDSSIITIINLKDCINGKAP